MSFAPRPVNPHQNQSQRFGSNPSASSRLRGQSRTNSTTSHLSDNKYENRGVNNTLGNDLVDNAGKSNVADFTARRQRQFSTAQISQLSNFSRTPLNFSPTSKTSPASSVPTFVPPDPWWTRSLLFLKYGSGLLTGGLIFVAITVYGSNVSNQREWSENYQQLESLRRKERQLVVANEVIKNKAAQESTTTKQLVQLDPAKRLYLPAPETIPDSSPKVIGADLSRNNAVPKTQPTDKNYSNQPLGY